MTADVTVDGTEYHPERVFSDYADMGGVMYARTFTDSWMPEAVETATAESIDISPVIGADRFAIPDSLVASEQVDPG